MPSEWYGDRQNGVEVRRRDDGAPDELFLFVGGNVVMHMEDMGDGYWLAILEPPGRPHVHVNLQAFPSDLGVTVEENV